MNVLLVKRSEMVGRFTELQLKWSILNHQSVSPLFCWPSSSEPGASVCNKNNPWITFFIKHTLLCVYVCRLICLWVTRLVCVVVLVQQELGHWPGAADLAKLGASERASKSFIYPSQLLKLFNDGKHIACPEFLLKAAHLSHFFLSPSYGWTFKIMFAVEECPRSNNLLHM